MKALLSLLPLLLVGAAQPERVPVERAQIVRAFPHDTGAFTEGLLYLDGKLYESTGMEGRSFIREVRLEDGKVIRQAAIPPQYFGEGIVNWGTKLISVTWQHGLGFIWDRATLKRTGEWRYPGEGWGMTQNGREIVMSDGTPQLRFLDPDTLKELRRLTVTANGSRVARLNELEWVKGEVLANVWQTDRIARIDPATGRVKAWIDLSPLTAKVPRRGIDDVPNGIAYDAKGDRLFVTGKNWPYLFEIRTVRR
ncbi:glutaminyl-peptide cyclotransferase [Sphingomonas sp. MAH-20]|uniref:Glutaminyl-peptide cyclotransferase n=1 Tax=Sphingomonas horti TaxID=2682842 RepID=A0A6I4IXE1_9SPHN|nr:glutaminyl-peptide cyclotransferase [Sphingomonas sp. CGMCC 1.13658]MBA2920513.1 glutaminyl-peptide cyclotransferase [Sphingomonas sp. CGMCC 1.13658]MVO76765.1 glutaminyl-peptide cyclotransferase [Sphingomonas horti]